jgi:hypothetical protein
MEFGLTVPRHCQASHSCWRCEVFLQAMYPVRPRVNPPGGTVLGGQRTVPSRRLCRLRLSRVYTTIQSPLRRGRRQPHGRHSDASSRLGHDDVEVRHRLRAGGSRFPSGHQRLFDMPDCCGAVLVGSRLAPLTGTRRRASRQRVSRRRIPGKVFDIREMTIGVQRWLRPRPPRPKSGPISSRSSDPPDLFGGRAYGEVASHDRVLPLVVAPQVVVLGDPPHANPTC